MCKWLGRFFVAIFIVGIFGWWGVRALPGWLANGDGVGPADAIVVMGGDPTRAVVAARLFGEGMAPEVYIAAPVGPYWWEAVQALGVEVQREEVVVRAVLVRLGVPEAHIHQTPGRVLSTVEEVGAWRGALPPEARRVLVVTSPYHVRRTRWVWQSMFPDREIRVVASDVEPYPERWWTRQESARVICLEVLKIFYYVLGGRFLSGGSNA